MIPKCPFVSVLSIVICASSFVEIDTYFYIEYREMRFHKTIQRDYVFECKIIENDPSLQPEEGAKSNMPARYIRCNGIHCILEKPDIYKKSNFFRIVYPQLPEDLPIRFYYVGGGSLVRSYLPDSMYIGPNSLFAINPEYPEVFDTAEKTWEMNFKTCKRMMPIPVPNEEEASKLADYVSLTKFSKLKAGDLQEALFTYKNTLGQIIKEFSENCKPFWFTRVRRREKYTKDADSILKLKKQLMLATMVLLTKVIDPCDLAKGNGMDPTTADGFCSTYCQFLSVAPMILNFKWKLPCTPLLPGKCTDEICFCSRSWIGSICRSTDNEPMLQFHNSVRRKTLSQKMYDGIKAFLAPPGRAPSLKRSQSSLKTL